MVPMAAFSTKTHMGRNKNAFFLLTEQYSIDILNTVGAPIHISHAGFTYFHYHVKQSHKSNQIFDSNATKIIIKKRFSIFCFSQRIVSTTEQIALGPSNVLQTLL